MLQIERAAAAAEPEAAQHELLELHRRGGEREAAARLQLAAREIEGLDQERSVGGDRQRGGEPAGSAGGLLPAELRHRDGERREIQLDLGLAHAAGFDDCRRKADRARDRQRQGQPEALRRPGIDRAGKLVAAFERRVVGEVLAPLDGERGLVDRGLADQLGMLVVDGERKAPRAQVEQIPQPPSADVAQLRARRDPHVQLVEIAM